MMAMVAENRSVKVLLHELLGSEGCSLHVRPSCRYWKAGEMLSFASLQKRAQQYDEILCGFQDRSHKLGTVMNPTDKSTEMDWEGVDLVVIEGKSTLVEEGEVRCFYTPQTKVPSLSALRFHY